MRAWVSLELPIPAKEEDASFAGLAQAPGAHQRQGSESHSEDPEGFPFAHRSPDCSRTGAASWKGPSAQSRDLFMAGPEAFVRSGHVPVPGSQEPAPVCQTPLA